MLLVALVKTIVAHRAALRQTAELGDSQASKHAAEVLAGIDEYTVGGVEALVVLYEGLLEPWFEYLPGITYGADGAPVAARTACPECGDSGIRPLCLDCYFIAGLAMPGDTLAEVRNGAELHLVDGRVALTRDGHTRLGPIFQR